MSLEPIDVFPLWDIMGEEINSIGAVTDKSPETKKRILTRSVFSFIEGILYAIRQLCLSKPDLLSLEEKIILNETTASLNDQGDARRVPVFMPTDKIARFTFKLFERVRETEWGPDYSGEGWKSFCASIKVRNRIVHPRNCESLKISKEEINAVKHAYEWFAATSLTILVADNLVLFKSIKWKKVDLTPDCPEEVAQKIRIHNAQVDIENDKIQIYVKEGEELLKHYKAIAALTSQKYDENFQQKYNELTKNDDRFNNFNVIKNSPYRLKTDPPTNPLSP